MTITVAEICRYPVKGLNAERLLHDRRFALAHGATAFDPRAPEWHPKTHFLMLMRDAKLA